MRRKAILFTVANVVVIGFLVHLFWPLICLLFLTGEGDRISRTEIEAASGDQLQLIPKIIHQTWITCHVPDLLSGICTTKPIPDKWKEAYTSVKTIHRDYEYKVGRSSHFLCPLIQKMNRSPEFSIQVFSFALSGHFLWLHLAANVRIIIANTPPSPIALDRSKLTRFHQARVCRTIAFVQASLRGLWPFITSRKVGSLAFLEDLLRSQSNSTIFLGWESLVSILTTLFDST